MGYCQSIHNIVMDLNNVMQEIVFCVVCWRDLEFDCTYNCFVLLWRGGTSYHKLIVIICDECVCQGERDHFTLKGNCCILSYFSSIQPKKLDPTSLWPLHLIRLRLYYSIILELIHNMWNVWYLMNFMLDEWEVCFACNYSMSWPNLHLHSTTKGHVLLSYIRTDHLMRKMYIIGSEI